MSGTDPDAGRNRPIDRTQSYRPGQAGGTPPPPDPNLPKIPGITLHFEIARGGMGVVYSGRQDFLDRRVAVKLLSVELGGESFVQRFQREAKILAGIKHPNIVACHLAGTTDDGQSYLVMEFIDGPSLKKWVTDNGPLSVPAALRLTRAVAQALAHAHTLGIIHRDVKPENILLETVTSTALDVNFPFTPKVVDLGLARGADTGTSLGLTSPGSVMGTPATMSPEQYDEPEAVDFRTDIYGLGCALYEMLVGHPAFRGKKLTDIVTQKRAQKAPDPCSENPKIPPAVGALVQCMLATHRDDRPRSYKELDERLAELLTALTVNRTRQQPAAPPVGSDTGATIVAKITPPTPGLGAATDRPAAPSNPPAGSPPASGPGLLRTAEINFLAEGLGAGPAAGPAATAFREGTAPPFPSATVATAPPGPAEPAPLRTAGSSTKKWALLGVGVVVAAAIGFLVSGGGGGPGPEPRPPDDRPGPRPPAGGNRVPAVAMQGPEEVDLKQSFQLSAVATDPDGDALTYAWSWPEDMLLARGQVNGSHVTFKLDDGLPGMEAEVRVDVRDSKGGSATATRTLRIGKAPVDAPLRGFDSTWQVDRADRRWIEITDPADRHVSCRAVDRLRTMQTSLGPESYWEWFGTLVSLEEATGFAKVGLRFEFGERGWAIVCHRSEADGLLWTVEVMEAVPSRDVWELRGLPTPVRAQFRQPDDTQDDYRGWFSVQRRGQRLSLQVGEARLPLGSTELQTKMVEPLVVDLPAIDGEPRLTLFVDQGIGRFRVSRR